MKILIGKNYKEVVFVDEFLEKIGKPNEVNYKKFIRNVEKKKYGNYSDPNWSPGKTKFKYSFLNDGVKNKIWYFYCDKLENFRNLDHID